MTHSQDCLRQGATQFGLDLTEAQLSRLTQYSQILIAWNRRVNLTRITEPEEIAVKHFLDSLSIYPLLPAASAGFSLIDVGSGAGFPGLPLKIALPQIKLTLLEATAKKTAFLQHAVDSLALTDVTVATARAEEAGRQTAHRETYDVAVARAVAPLPVLAEYMLPFIKVGGQMIAQKGRHPGQEVKSAANALGILGGAAPQIIPVTVPGLPAARHLILIPKIKQTPKQYPRRPGTPAKKPI